MSLRYIDYFMSLKCAGDVLNVCNPVQNVSKEISEAMALIFRMKTLTINNPMKYNVLDLCAGNSLVSVISTMLLPVSFASAVDKKVRNRKWHLVDRFEALTFDIFDPAIFDLIDEDTVIVSCHPCDSLAIRTADIFAQSRAKALFMMPCCSNSEVTNKAFTGNQLLKDKLNKYELWCLSIFNSLKDTTVLNPFDGSKLDVKMSYDPKCLSPKNIIISAEIKENKSNEKSSIQSSKGT